jgi:hypothetical protein
MLHTKHEIKLPELQEWLLTAEMIYASDGEGKRLVVNASGGFTLWHNNTIFWQGVQPFMAVEKYNSL